MRPLEATTGYEHVLTESAFLARTNNGLYKEEDEAGNVVATWTWHIAGCDDYVE